MYCSDCGAYNKDGENFCSSCGAKLSGGAPGQVQFAQPSNAGQPPRKKPGKGLWIGIGAVVLVAIAAVVLFVYPGVLVNRGLSGLLSGDTVQTRFVNDNAAVFVGAFEGLKNDTAKDLLGKPFSLSMDIDAEIGGDSESVSLDMAYDEQTLGANAKVAGQSVTLKLLEDVLYVSVPGGYVQGVRFDTDADLSEKMPLKERIAALAENMQGDTASLDYRKLAETFFNSIDKDCFEKSASKTTLAMDADDLIAMLETFIQKLQDDDDLLDSLEDYIKDISGSSADVIDALNDAIDSLEESKDKVDPSLEWVVSYQGGKPVSIELTIEAAGDELGFSFEYENTGSATDIDFAIEVPDSGITGSMKYEKTTKGIEYSGDIAAEGQTISFEGSESWSDDDISGEVTLEAGGQTVKLSYDGTLTIRAPKTNVDDDSAYDIDTDNATVMDIKDLMGGLGSMPGVSSVIPNMESPIASENSLEGRIYATQGFSSEGTEEAAFYFENGLVYIGTVGMTIDEIRETSNLYTPYGITYTFDGMMLVMTSNGETRTFSYDVYSDMLVAEDGTVLLRVQ